MKRLLFLGIVVLLLSAASAFANPDYAYYRQYFDENGCVVGTERLTCQPQYTATGVQTDCVKEDILEYCQDFYFPTCPDNGLNSTNCGTCVSDRYLEWWGYGWIPDPCL